MHEAKATTEGRIAAAGLALCAAWLVLLAAFPPVYALCLGDGCWLDVWPHGALYPLRWVLVAVSLLLPAGAYAAVRRARCAAGGENVPGRAVPWLTILTPMVFLPPVAALVVLAPHLPAGVPGTALFLVPPAIGASILCRFPAGWFGTLLETRRAAWWGIGLLALLIALYTAFGIHLAANVGEHFGDEGHYIILSQSLYRDGDLDLKNDMMEECKTQNPRAISWAQMHLARNSRDGHWYSWHPYGLSLLLAPVWPLGMPGRQAVLALVAGLGCAGLFLLMRRAGASRPASLVVLSALAASNYWALYSVRAVPEMLGAMLVTWQLWALAAQRDRPWGTVWIGAAACVALAFAHGRYMPVSLMGFGLYGLWGLFGRENWARKILRLGVFTLLCAAGYGLYLWIQYRMFERGSGYASFFDEVLFRFWPGAWTCYVDTRGILVIFPLLAWMLAAQVVWFVRDPARRWLAACLGLAYVVVVLVTCTNGWSVGGSCVPGRYQVTLMPFLLPGAAIVLERTRGLARWWFAFLALLSLYLLVLLLLYLPGLGKSFGLPFQAVAGQPLFQGMYHPHVFMQDMTLHKPAHLWGTIYGVSFLAATLVVLLLPERRRWLGVFVLLLLIPIGIRVHGMTSDESPRHRRDRDWVSGFLGRVDLDRALVRRRPMETPLPLYDMVKHTFQGVPGADVEISLTTRDEGKRQMGTLYCQPRLEQNDWAGRGFRWLTLRRPFRLGRGQRLLHLKGRADGTATPVLAIREGSNTIFEGPLPVAGGRMTVDVPFQTRGRRGSLYVLLRLEGGEGRIDIEEFWWCPWSEKFLRDANLRLPEGVLQEGPRP